MIDDIVLEVVQNICSGRHVDAKELYGEPSN